MERREEILEEIRQMLGQYKAEVPGGRRAWPRSIKERAAELFQIGMRAKAISDQTGVPYFTVLNWRKSGEGTFREVKCVTSRALAPLCKEVGTVTVPIKNPATGTVTVTTKEGMRIEGLTFPELLRLWGKIR